MSQRFNDVELLFAPLRSAALQSYSTNGSTVGNFDLEHLSRLGRDLPWRVNVKADLWLDISIDDDRREPVDFVYLADTDLHETWSFEVFDAGGKSLGSSGTVSGAVTGSIDEFKTLADLRLSLGPPFQLVEDLRSSFRLSSYGKLSSPAYGARRIRLTFPFAGGSNGALDELQIGNVFFGEMWRPNINMTYGWALTRELRDETVRNRTGTLTGTALDSVRVLSLAMPYLKAAEAWESVEFITRQLGGVDPIFAWAQPDLGRYFYQQAFIGTLRRAPSIGLQNLSFTAATGLELVETL